MKVIKNVEKGENYPSIVNYLYHEEIRGSGNTGKRNVM